MSIAVDSLEKVRFNLLEQQVRPWNVFNPDVLTALKETPREQFVPKAYADFAFVDTRIPLGHDQYMLTPLIEGRILQECRINTMDNILVVGSGSGYLAACASKLAEKVDAIDGVESFIHRATTLMTADNLNYQACRLQDFSAEVKYSIIILTAATATVPEECWQLLQTEGKIFGFMPKNHHSSLVSATLWQRDDQGHITSNTFFESEMEYLQGFEPQPVFEF